MDLGFARAQPAPAFPPPAPSAESAQPAPAVQRGTILQQFAQDIVGRVRAYLRHGVVYPPEALANRWEGTVRIAVLYGRGGDIEGIVVKESSGHRLLDDAALEIVRAMDLPRAPSALHGIEFDVTFPIVFRLQVLPAS